MTLQNTTNNDSDDFFASAGSQSFPPNTAPAATSPDLWNTANTDPSSATSTVEAKGEAPLSAQTTQPSAVAPAQNLNDLFGDLTSTNSSTNTSTVTGTNDSKGSLGGLLFDLSPAAPQSAADSGPKLDFDWISTNSSTGSNNASEDSNKVDADLSWASAFATPTVAAPAPSNPALGDLFAASTPDSSVVTSVSADPIVEGTAPVAVAPVEPAPHAEPSPAATTGSESAHQGAELTTSQQTEAVAGPSATQPPAEEPRNTESRVVEKPAEEVAQPTSASAPTPTSGEDFAWPSTPQATPSTDWDAFPAPTPSQPPEIVVKASQATAAGDGGDLFGGPGPGPSSPDVAPSEPNPALGDDVFASPSIQNTNADVADSSVASAQASPGPEAPSLDFFASPSIHGSADTHGVSSPPVEPKQAIGNDFFASPSIGQPTVESSATTAGGVSDQDSEGPKSASSQTEAQDFPAISSGIASEPSVPPTTTAVSATASDDFAWPSAADTPTQPSGEKVDEAASSPVVGQAVASVGDFDWPEPTAPQAQTLPTNDSAPETSPKAPDSTPSTSSVSTPNQTTDSDDVDFASASSAPSPTKTAGDDDFDFSKPTSALVTNRTGGNDGEDFAWASSAPPAEPTSTADTPDVPKPTSTAGDDDFDFPAPTSAPGAANGAADDDFDFPRAPKPSTTAGDDDDFAWASSSAPSTSNGAGDDDDFAWASSTAPSTSASDDFGDDSAWASAPAVATTSTAAAAPATQPLPPVAAALPGSAFPPNASLEQIAQFLKTVLEPWTKGVATSSPIPEFDSLLSKKKLSDLIDGQAAPPSVKRTRNFHQELTAELAVVPKTDLAERIERLIKLRQSQPVVSGASSHRRSIPRSTPRGPPYVYVPPPKDAAKAAGTPPQPTPSTPKGSGSAPVARKPVPKVEEPNTPNKAPLEVKPVPISKSAEIQPAVAKPAPEKDPKPTMIGDDWTFMAASLPPKATPAATPASVTAPKAGSAKAPSVAPASQPKAPAAKSSNYDDILNDLVGAIPNLATFMLSSELLVVKGKGTPTQARAAKR